MSKTNEPMGGAESAMRDAAKAGEDAFRSATDPEVMARAQAAMGIDPARMQETVREMTERSVEQSRDAYRRMKSAAEEASRTLESTAENAHNGSLTLTRKAIDAMRSNAEMGFEHLEKLAGARSVAELIELQTGFVRRQIEAATDQVKEMQALSRDVAQELMRPGRDAAEKMKGGF